MLETLRETLGTLRAALGTRKETQGTPITLHHCQDTPGTQRETLGTLRETLGTFRGALGTLRETLGMPIMLRHCQVMPGMLHQPITPGTLKLSAERYKQQMSERHGCACSYGKTKQNTITYR